MKTVLVMILAWGLPAYAQPQVSEPPSDLSCDVTLIAHDVPGGVSSQTLKRPAKASGSHGGEPIGLKFGEYQVFVMADSIWRGLDWRRGDKVIATSIVAADSALPKYHVLLVYNPENSDEQASLTCGPVD